MRAGDVAFKSQELYKQLRRHKRARNHIHITLEMRLHNATHQSKPRTQLLRHWWKKRHFTRGIPSYSQSSSIDSWMTCYLIKYDRI